MGRTQLVLIVLSEDAAWEEQIWGDYLELNLATSRLNGLSESTWICLVTAGDFSARKLLESCLLTHHLSQPKLPGHDFTPDCTHSLLHTPALDSVTSSPKVLPLVFSFKNYFADLGVYKKRVGSFPFLR